MGRCGTDPCSAAGCQCATRSTDSFLASGTGPPSRPFRYDLRLDDDPANAARVGPAGLFVDPGQPPLSAYAASDPSGVLITLTDIYQNVPAMTVTLDLPEPSYVMVVGMLTFNVDDDVTALLQGKLAVDGNELAVPLIELSSHGDGQRASVGASWNPFVGAGQHTFTLKAARNNAFPGGGIVQAGAIYAEAF